MIFHNERSRFYCYKRERRKNQIKTKSVQCTFTRKANTKHNGLCGNILIIREYLYSVRYGLLKLLQVDAVKYELSFWWHFRHFWLSWIDNANYKLCCVMNIIGLNLCTFCSIHLWYLPMNCLVEYRLCLPLVTL